MLADPLTLGAVSHARTRLDGSRSTYASEDGTSRITVSHQTTGKSRSRHMFRCDQDVVAANPVDATNALQTLGFYLVIDEPSWGFADADIVTAVNAMITLLQASTNSVMKAVIASQL